MKRGNLQNRERMEKWRVHVGQYDPRACRWLDVGSRSLVFPPHAGKDAEQVAELIKSENPDIKTVQIVPEVIPGLALKHAPRSARLTFPHVRGQGAMVTMDVRMVRRPPHPPPPDARLTPCRLVCFPRTACVYTRTRAVKSRPSPGSDDVRTVSP